MDGVDYLATVRGRLGYAFGPTLVYATGGVAFASFNDDSLFNGGDSETGWVAGGGLEYKLRNNWSVGAEGLYYDFSNNNDFNFNDDATFFVARARLTYHFGGYGDGLK
jgi:outer membrane immunogenic protein